MRGLAKSVTVVLWGFALSVWLPVLIGAVDVEHYQVEILNRTMIPTSGTVRVVDENGSTVRVGFVGPGRQVRFRVGRTTSGVARLTFRRDAPCPTDCPRVITSERFFPLEGDIWVWDIGSNIVYALERS